ncbi:MAG: hypothetical protein QG641_2516, partial [Candidatus Poribacteria bacterium]|nr:hypothetical protein [Candidatus Poribacteria bacterium]
TFDILSETIKKVYIKNLITGEVINELSFNDSVNTLSFSPDGRFLAVGILSGKTVLWDMIGESKVPKEVWRDKMPANIVTFPAAITFSSPTTVSFSPDGELLAIGAGKKIAIWRINALIDTSLEKLIEIPTDYEIKDLAWNSNGNLLSDGQQIFRIIVPKEAIPKDPTGSGIGRPKDPTGSGAGRPKDPTGSGIGRPKKKEPDPKDPTGSGVGRPKE